MSSKSFRLFPGASTPALGVVLPLSDFSEGYQVLPSSLTTPPEATFFFHSFSVRRSLPMARQASPLPSITPAPVIATFSRLAPETGDWLRAAGRPSQLPSTSGYWLTSLV